ncbi:MAG: SIMPL domain-containing protein [Candidatus Niyogibacteria bacterium]|nr:SIMPL domain-containing protein [Candidatus Niyogibacteria bacterium]
MFHHLFKGCCGKCEDGKHEGGAGMHMCGHQGKRWLMLALLAVLTLWIGAKFVSEAKGLKGVYPNVPTITVTGEGKVLAKPDIGIVTFSVWRESKDVGTAQEQATKATNAIVDYLKGAGVEEKDLKTTSYNITPMYDYTRSGSVFRGYQIRQSFELKIRDLAKVGSHLTKIAGLGANEVGSLRFDVDNIEALRAEARAKAIADAKAKAKQLARDLRVDLDDIVSYSESGGGAIPIYARSLEFGVGGDGFQPPQTPAGENEITVTVYLGFEIDD